MKAATTAPRSGDLVSGPIMATLIAFSLPTLASNVLQSLNGSINAIWVGRVLGESALAATANANLVMFLMFSAVFGFGMAATVRVGHCFGAGDLDGARRAFGTAIGFCVGLTVIVSAIGWVFAPQLLRLLSTPAEAYSLALDYLRVMFVSLPAGMVGLMISMGLRGAGDAKTPLYMMILTVALDIVLNPLLILGVGPIPPLGIAGSALATAIAGFVGLLWVVRRLYKRDLPVRLRGAELRYLIPQREELRYILAKGIPMGAQMILFSASALVMIGLVNREGLLTTAAYSAATQLWTYVQMPAMAISAAVSAMAAQAIGAGMWSRVEKATNAAVIVNVVTTGALVVLLLWVDVPLLSLFLGSDSPAIPLARHMQVIATWNFVLFGVTMVLFGTMRANGVVWTPLFVMFAGVYITRFGFYFAAYPVIGSDALWWSFPVGSVISTSLAVFAYSRKGWRGSGHNVPPEQSAEESLTDSEPAGRMNPTM